MIDGYLKIKCCFFNEGINMYKLIAILCLFSWSNIVNAAAKCFDGKYYTSQEKPLPSVIIDIRPMYPTNAAKENLSGCVAINFKIEKKGNVSNIQVIDSSSTSDFNHSSIEALKKWIFEKQNKQTNAAIIFEYSVDPLPTSKQKLIPFIESRNSTSRKITSDIDEAPISEIEKLKIKILTSDSKSALAVEKLKHQISLLEYEHEQLSKIQNSAPLEKKKLSYSKISKQVSDRDSIFKPLGSFNKLDYAEAFESDDEELRFLRKYRTNQAKDNSELVSMYLSIRKNKQLEVIQLKVAIGLSEQLTPYENDLLDKEKLELQKAKAEAEAEKIRKEELAKFYSLGNCNIGNFIYHREVWDSKTSSGNMIADTLFNASIKESFIITFEAVVEGFEGDKVKTTINNYTLKQTLGGGVLDQKTYRKYDVARYADKYIGRVQFYEKSRCN